MHVFSLCATEKTKGKFKTSTPKTAENRKSRTLPQSPSAPAPSRREPLICAIFGVMPQKQNLSGSRNSRPLKRAAVAAAGEVLFLRHKAEKSHEQRLPPRGSCRGATEGECAASVFLPLSVLEKIHDRHFLKLEVIIESMK